MRIYDLQKPLHEFEDDNNINVIIEDVTPVDKKRLNPIDVGILIFLSIVLIFIIYMGCRSITNLSYYYIY